MAETNVIVNHEGREESGAAAYCGDDDGGGGFSVGLSYDCFSSCLNLFVDFSQASQIPPNMAALLTFLCCSGSHSHNFIPILHTI